MNRPIIRLWGMENIGLIIEYQTGIIYSNQTGGYACLQPEVEGVLVPLEDLENKIQQSLQKYFTGPKWRSWCNDGIDEETADFIDSLLKPFYYLKVNRSKLLQSHEAWIYMELLLQKGDLEYQIYSGFLEKSGILTWGNSD
ncbi:DUF6210 family protein [Leptospira interrogans]|uniref:Lipoprotein n=12 Tax=Leptospira interrogans TaxID=173 RepID=Q8F5H4_LEPIN|nr:MULTISPECIES: DUF6210 family protein [Leptospira]APH41907.1 Putative lipoprotein [Leptospira interrogans serovar Copenhageni/Icterohaemorrhagiae]EMG21741.1 putative lipoprotein [Leptospira interrogans serovar Copenhageni str. LT2050]EMM84659.1 putative lipoprotein [Leptospira interrogans str. 2006001854]EMN28295.1 putative lipoprotein [Leptospira interrogans serovar Pyrogenes str. L0374]EMN73668.1 putative lipoprotein [Leptospira interrogans serovar Bataviae str. UI 08561]EMP04685.1 putati